MSVSRRASNQEYDMFDELLKNADSSSWTPLVSDESNYVGRNLYTLTADEDEYVLCHVPVMFRWSVGSSDAATSYVGTVKGGLFVHEDSTDIDVSSDAYSGSAGALLAIHHFNTGNGTIIDEFDGISDRCPIRFTTELLDSQSTSSWAMQQLTRMLSRGPPDATAFTTTPNLPVAGQGETSAGFNGDRIQKNKPQPCALLGSSSTDVTKKMAIIAGIYDIPQVSSVASSVLLDDQQEFPLFARTRPSDSSTAQLSIDYLVTQLNVNFVGVLYLDDTSGSAYNLDIQKFGAKNNVTVYSESFRFGATDDELKLKLEKLADTGYRYFLGVYLGGDYERIMTMAYELGIAGPDYFWMFNGGLASSFVTGFLSVPKDSPAAKALYGNAVVTVEGGLPGLNEHHDRFINVWESVDQEFLDYFHSKHPPTPMGSDIEHFERTKDFFSGWSPSSVAAFSYDAVASLALSACQAWDDVVVADTSVDSAGVFTGTEHHARLVDTGYQGASGNMIIGPDTFSRKADSAYHVISNILPLEKEPSDAVAATDGVDITYFQGLPLTVYDTSTHEWTAYKADCDFIYSDGSTDPPMQIPPCQPNYNTITRPVRAVCMSLASLSMVLSIAVFVYCCILKRNHAVIRAAQPIFLAMICAGTFLMALSIFPAAIDDSIASTRVCDVSCILDFWLKTIGFCLIFSALFSKLWRINMLFSKASRFQRVQVRYVDVLVPFGILMGLNVLLMTLWTALDPLHWERIHLEYDDFGRVLESTGHCTSNHFSAFMIPLLAVDGCAMVLAIWQAYVGHAITTEFNESQYIAMATACIFQSIFMGVPIIIIVEDQPTAYLFVDTGITTIICLSILLLLFSPKVYSIMSKDEQPIRISMGGASRVSNAASTVGAGGVGGGAGSGAGGSATKRGSSSSSYSPNFQSISMTGTVVSSYGYHDSNNKNDGSKNLHGSFSASDRTAGSFELSPPVSGTGSSGTSGTGSGGGGGGSSRLLVRILDDVDEEEAIATATTKLTKKQTKSSS